MNTIKEFLKPNGWKATVFIGSGLLSYFYVKYPDPMVFDMPTYRGFPFAFYGFGGWSDGIIWQGAVLDIAILYLLSCFIYFIFAVIKRRTAK